MRRSMMSAGLVLLAGTMANAQPPGFGRPPRPPISPYLNLLNGNNSDAFNYYQLYRPQKEFRNAYQGLNRGLYQTDRQVVRQGESIEEIAGIVRPGAALSSTGHVTSFMNYGRYFPMSNRAPGAATGPFQR